jgi:Lrp/AsnC family transcriptional regulator
VANRQQVERRLAAVVTMDIAGLNAVYKKSIAWVPLSDVTSSFAMEQIKSTTSLPLDFV